MKDSDDSKNCKSPKHYAALQRANDRRRQAARLRNEDAESAVEKALHNATSQPVSFTDELAEEILIRVALGQSLKYICTFEHMPSIWALQKWIYGYHGEPDDRAAKLEHFRLAYPQAKEYSVQLMAEEMLDIADEAIDRDSAMSAKVRIEVRQWMCERRAPKDFAPAAQRAVEEDFVEDFATKYAAAVQSIEEAKQRRLAQSSGDVIEGECISLPSQRSDHEHAVLEHDDDAVLMSE